jgi:hypothetical protein
LADHFHPQTSNNRFATLPGCGLNIVGMLQIPAIIVNWRARCAVRAHISLIDRTLSQFVAAPASRSRGLSSGLSHKSKTMVYAKQFFVDGLG